MTLFRTIRICAMSLVLSFCNAIQAQGGVPYRSLIFLEIGGLGGIGSINYQHDIALNDHLAIGFRGGLGTVHLMDYRRKFNPDLIVPLSVQMLYGRIHRIEMGIGQTIANYPVADLKRLPIHTRATHFSTTFSAGYRFDHPQTRLFYRCTYTPYVEKNKHFKHWGALSIGYAFK